MESVKKQMRIGLGQLLVEGGEPERNLARAESMIAKAADNGCELLLLPECMDFGWTHPSAIKESLPIPGDYSDRFCELAHRFNLYICVGLSERDKERVYNTAILIDAKGKIILKYRKINVLSVAQEYYEVGNFLSVAETPFGCIGVNICSDNYFDSLSIGHTLARMGAQIILSPSSWTVDYSVDETVDPYREKWIRPYSLLASLYDLIIAGTTSVGYIVGGPYEGKKMVGCSLIVDKSGMIMRGPYLEFAGDLIVTDIKVPFRKEKGTAIGEMLKKKGYRFDCDEPKWI